jgi:hypothetical protein
VTSNSLKKLAWGGLFLAILMVLTASRCLVGAFHEFENGTEKEQQRDLYEAALHYSRAVRWHFPGNTYSLQAASALEKLYKSQQENKLYAQMLISSVNSVKYSGDRLANYRREALLFLSGDLAAALDLQRTTTAQGSARYAAAALFWGWLGFMGLTILYGFNKRGVVVRSQKTAFLFLGTFSMWLIWLFTLSLA